MAQGLPHVFKTLANMAYKMVELNEKSDKGSSSESDEELSDGAYQKALNKLSSAKKGEEKSAGQEPQIEMGDAEENSSDSDIEVEDSMQKEAGDFSLYYSPLDSVNELYYVKTRLEGSPMGDKSPGRDGAERDGTI